jgi:spore germination protein GerM
MRRVTLAAVVLTLVASCGLPDDERPRLIAEAEAPIDLSPTTAPQDPGDAEDEVIVFFINAEAQLEPLRLPVEEVTVDNALAVLLAGAPAGNPLTSAIPQATALRGPTTVQDRVLTVDLTPGPAEGGIQSVTGERQIQAVAQIVQTATALPGIGSVRFLVDGVPIAVLTGSGASTQDPVSRSDYERLQPG